MKDEVVLKEYTIDNKEYLVINEIDYNNLHYIFLSNKNNNKDIAIRKVVNGYLDYLEDNELLEVLSQVAK